MIFRVKVFAFSIGTIALLTILQDIRAEEQTQQQLPPQYQQSIQQRLDIRLFEQYTDDEIKWRELLKEDPTNEYYKYKVEQIEKRKQAIEEKYFLNENNKL